jgi:hypothetical protein
MENSINPIKQKTMQGCLVACLGMLIRLPKIPLKEEKNILINGLNMDYEFFTVGVIEEFLKKNNKSLELYVDNKYFSRVLKKKFKNKKVKILNQKINMPFLDKLLNDSPIIGYIDYKTLGDYSHAPHFILIEKKENKKYTIIDPWTGKRQKLNEEKLMKGIKLLKEHLKICPLVIKLKNVK